MMLSPLVWCVRVSASDRWPVRYSRISLPKASSLLTSLEAKCCISWHNSRVNKAVLNGMSAVLAHLRQSLQTHHITEAEELAIVCNDSS